ncbi:MAG: hypothetical protein HXS43_08040 [Theionarchaea archaeon]|nr:hypothetical protein [Theionarchaea archaeon]
MTEKMIDTFLMRTYLETVENIVGPNGLKSVLNFAHLEKYIDNFPSKNGGLTVPVKDTQELFHALKEVFGEKGTRSFSLRVGRGFARLATEGLSDMAKALQVVARLLPEGKKMRVMLEKIIEQNYKMYTVTPGTPTITIEETEDSFLFIHRDRFESEGVHSEKPVCNIYVGMVEYFIEWITGHRHEVKEIKCRAMGHPTDVFRISKQKQ